MEVRVELEGAVRRIFGAIDDSDSDYGESHGNAEKWTDPNTLRENHWDSDFMGCTEPGKGKGQAYLTFLD